jgi:predicted acylesterase/phospholipase RssA
MMPRALVISGGGAKGAFAVGALKRLARDPTNLDFDVVAGTSIGAVITPFVVTKDIALLEKLFTGLKTKDVVRRLDRVLKIYNNGYVYSSKELRKRLTENLTSEKVDLILNSSSTTSYYATVCLQTGRITHFHAGRQPANTPNTPYDSIPITTRAELIDAIIASANMPVLMGPMIKREDRQYVDGGVRAYAPFQVALDQGATALWAILHTPPPEARSVEGGSFRNLAGVLSRTISLLTEDVGDNDYELATLKMQARGLSTGNILRPPQDIEEAFGIKALEFDPASMRKLVDHGEEVARNKGW